MPGVSSMNDRKMIIRHLLMSLLLSLLAGVLVWTLTMVVAWQTVRKADGIRPKQWKTQHVILRDVTEAALDYQNTTGSPPQSIDDLKEANPDKFNKDGAWVDAWKWPLVFSFDDNLLLVTSYGRDGMPGGVGLDHDLTNAEPTPAASLMTFRQFLSHKSARTTREWCSKINYFLFVFTAMAIFMSVFIVPRLSEQQKAGIVSYVISLVVIIVASSVIGGTISLLHVPLLPSITHQTSGH